MYGHNANRILPRSPTVGFVPSRTRFAILPSVVLSFLLSVAFIVVVVPENSESSKLVAWISGVWIEVEEMALSGWEKDEGLGGRRKMNVRMYAAARTRASMMVKGKLKPSLMGGEDSVVMLLGWLEGCGMMEDVEWGVGMDGWDGITKS